MPLMNVQGPKCMKSTDHGKGRRDREVGSQMKWPVLLLMQLLELSKMVRAAPETIL